MRRSFRYVPPEPRPGALVRPRLLRYLLGRWRHRVTSVVGGPGLGKTTLLAQALAENRLAPQGREVWVTVEPVDADVDRFARVVATAMAMDEGEHGRPGRAARELAVPDPSVVTEAVLAGAPAETCLVFDDIHRLPAGSSAAAWLGELVAALPVNGHVVLSGRTEAPLPLARLAEPAGVLQVMEDELRFDEAELADFAALRGLDRDRFGETGGWPAMVELVASVNGRVAGDYLWEEVLEPLGADRRRVLAVLCDLGGGDDDLLSAAVEAPIELAEALRGVPLVDRARDGWHTPHALWARAPRLALEPIERRDLRRRAAEHLTERGRFDDAFRLVAEAELWDAAPPILRVASLDNHLAPNQLRQWLAVCPDSVRESVAGCLADAVYMAFNQPNDAIEPLQQAMARCRDAGDVDAELTVIAHLGLLAQWRQNMHLLLEVALRVAELEKTGRPRARALAAFARVVAANVEGDDDEIRRQLYSIEPGVLDPSWEVLSAFHHFALHIDQGEPELAYERVDQLYPTAPGSVRYLLDFLRLLGLWFQGRLDAAVAGFPPVVAEARATGVPYHVYLAQSYGCLGYSFMGDVAAARVSLEESVAAAPPPPTGERSGWTAVALASLLLAEGDEKEATVVLRQGLNDYDLDKGLTRRAWRQALALGYVLLPESRAYWDQLPLRGYLAAARTLAAAVVSIRAGRRGAPLRELDLPDLSMVRSALPFRFAAELALALSEVGRPEARAILDVFGLPGRAAVRDLAEAQPRRVRVARTLLAAVPAPPQRSTYLAVLGPLVLRRDGRDGEEVVDADLRRKRLQALIGYLIAHRRTTRAAIAADLWPELDERSAGNNLAVNLSRLLRVLEPWRDTGEPSYLVRQDGHTITLVTGPHLRIDADEFDAALRDASRAEAEGTASTALDHLLIAVGLYRDDLNAELPEADWFALDRQHYRTQFVATATRAGQLLVGRGDPEQAQHVARRALAVDPWSEDGYGVLIAAALAEGDRSGARRLLRRCLAALSDLGAQPSPAIQELHRRIQGAVA